MATWQQGRRGSVDPKAFGAQITAGRSTKQSSKAAEAKTPSFEDEPKSSMCAEMSEKQRILFTKGF